MPSKQSSKSTRRPLSSVSSQQRSNPQSPNSRMFTVAVQPPVQTRASTALYPPMVVKGRASSSTAAADAYYTFATAVLRDAEGNVLAEQLGGTVSASGCYLEERERRACVAFVFPDLYVPYAGSYSLRVDVYKLDYEDPQSAVLVDQAESRVFHVYDAAVEAQRPSSDERSLIRKLRDQGHSVPSGPS